MKISGHHHKTASQNLAFVFFMNLTFNIIVIVGGLATNSMAILADSIHDTSDTLSMGIAWVLEHISQKESSEKFSYGYQRFSILGAATTSVLIIVMAFFILSEAITRFFEPSDLDAYGMLVIGIVGIIFKTISVWRLNGGETFSEKAIFYNLVGDIFEWVAIVILSVILIFWTDITFLDSFISIGIALWLIFNLGRTLYRSFEVFLQKTPHDFDVGEFKTKIMEIDGVKAINDFHVWSLDGIDSVMTLKVSIDDLKHQEKIKEDIYNLSKEYRVVDITVDFSLN